MPLDEVVGGGGGLSTATDFLQGSPGKQNSTGEAGVGGLLDARAALGLVRKYLPSLLEEVGHFPTPTIGQVAVPTYGNANSEIGGLTISNPPTQAEVTALRDKCEELADDVRALATLVSNLLTVLQQQNLVCF